LQNRYKDATEKLEKDLHDMRSLLNVSKTLYENLELDKVLETIAYSCIGLVFSKEASIFLHKDYEGATFILKYSRGSSEAEKLENKLVIKDAKPLIELFTNKKKALLVSQIRKNKKLNPILKSIKKLTPVVIVPLMSNQGEIVGFLVLGEKLNRAKYTEADLNSLETLSGFAAISVENARLYERATQDFMTKLYNHGYFQVNLDDELERAKRYKSPLSLIIFDIDNFKSFNDTYGHQTGDMVLKNIGRIIKKSIALNGYKKSIAARYGGEEFAIILPCASWEEGGALAEDIRRNIQDHNFIDKDRILRVTCSFGVSTWTHHRPIAKPKFIDEADAASYQSKQKGKNAITVYEEARYY
jgi:diguanylate cyclase (GGDEF)-like protein